MKKVLTFISLIFIIAACESIPPNPLYLDTNGVTVKAHKWAKSELNRCFYFLYI